MLKIILLSDIHIGLNGELIYDIDTRKNFKTVLESVQQEERDLIIINGDIAHGDNFQEPYGWVKKQLDALQTPYYIISGNHDHSAFLARVFLMQKHFRKRKLFYKVNYKGFPLFFLDTSTNRVSQYQLKWLVNECSRLDQEALLFMHHPPALCDCTFMDSHYPLKNIAPVNKALKKCSSINNIFCGHYHIDKKVDIDGKKLYISPASWFQIDDKSRSFLISSYQPGYRIIHWNGNEVETFVKYLDL